jgi:hypothetical protein
LIETALGVPVDVSLGGLPFEARVVDRSTPFNVAEGVTFATCSAEDLVVALGLADVESQCIVRVFRSM